MINDLERELAGRVSFILSSARSGSTLLMRILNGHSRLCCPFQYGFPFLFRDSVKEPRIMSRHVILSKQYGMNWEDTYKDPASLILKILQEQNKQIFVAKDPWQTLFIKDLRTYFGDVPIIHLTRDVRQVAQSDNYEQKYEEAINNWYNRHSAVMEHMGRFSNVIRIRYEDLAARPGDVVGRLCHFLGLEFEPEMLRYWETRHVDDELELWDGVRPGESMMTQRLSANAIKATPKPVPQAVHEAVDNHTEAKRLNEYFGYTDQAWA